MRNAAKLFSVLLLGAILLLSCTEDDASDPAGNLLTGAWRSTVLSGPAAGSMGLLLTQSDSLVTGSFLGGSLAGTMIDGQFNCAGVLGDVAWLLSATLSEDGSALSGQLSANGESISVTFQRLSELPVNPDTSTPTVLGTVPAANAVDVQIEELAIEVHWSKPVNGWGLALTGPINGQETTIGGNELVDKTLNSWDPQTNTFTLHLSATLDPGATYTLWMDGSETVDWHDAFGVPAWPTPASSYHFTFTTAAPMTGYSCADFLGWWETHQITTSGQDAPRWFWNEVNIYNDCTLTGIYEESNGNSGNFTGSTSITNNGFLEDDGREHFQGAMNELKDIVVYTCSDNESSNLAMAVKQPTQVTMADLAGRWEDNRIASDPAGPWWMRGTLSLEANGDFQGEAVDDDGDLTPMSGTFPEISSNGVIEGFGDDIGTRGALNASKTVIVGTATWASGTPGAAELSVTTKMAEAYSQSDLAGTWSIHLISSGSGSPWWQRALATIDANGNLTASTVEYDGDSYSVSGVLQMDASGIIAIDGSSTFRGVLDATKTVLVWTTTQNGGASEMAIGVKMLR